jgi:integrase
MSVARPTLGIVLKDRITKRSVDALANGEFISDTEVKGFMARRLPSGKVTFGFQYSKAGRRPWLALGLHGSVTADEARKDAKRYAGLVAQNRDPAAEQEVKTARSTNTVNHVLDEWLAKYARDPDSGNLRSADGIESMFDRYVRPKIGDVVVYDLTLTMVVAMLDAVKDSVKDQTAGKKSGGTMANRVRAHFRSALEWWRDGDEKFVTNPIPSKKRGAKEKRRERVLDQEEFRDFWRATLELEGVEGNFWRTLFLSACRRSEVSDMNLSEFDKRKENWTIPAERYKTKLDHVIPLTPALAAHLPARGDRGDYLFSTTGGEVPLSGFSKFKPKLVKKINELRKSEGRGAIKNFTPHDLRRTANTFMIPAGVSAEVADRLLGHVQPGIRGVYNKWAYRDEKAGAIEKLATYVDGLLQSPPPNVVQFPGSSRADAPRGRRGAAVGR